MNQLSIFARLTAFSFIFFSLAFMGALGCSDSNNANISGSGTSTTGVFASFDGSGSSNPTGKVDYEFQVTPTDPSGGGSLGLTLSLEGSNSCEVTVSVTVDADSNPTAQEVFLCDLNLSLVQNFQIFGLPTGSDFTRFLDLSTGIGFGNMATDGGVHVPMTRTFSMIKGSTSGGFSFLSTLIALLPNLANLKLDHATLCMVAGGLKSMIFEMDPCGPGIHGFCCFSYKAIDFGTCCPDGDFEDPACPATLPEPIPGVGQAEICDNGQDDDADGFIDGDDLLCGPNPICESGGTCVPESTPEGTTKSGCSDKVDNDCDQKIDCEDSGCASHPICYGPPHPPPACPVGSPACPENVCPPPPTPNDPPYSCEAGCCIAPPGNCCENIFACQPPDVCSSESCGCVPPGP